MGWSGGTQIFDRVCRAIINNEKMDRGFKIDFIASIVEDLQEQDWDVENESDYFGDEIVKAAFRKLGQNYWYDNEENV